jgi:hypothetical protein
MRPVAFFSPYSALWAKISSGRRAGPSLNRPNLQPRPVPSCMLGHISQPRPGLSGQNKKSGRAIFGSGCPCSGLTDKRLSDVEGSYSPRISATYSAPPAWHSCWAGPGSASSLFFFLFFFLFSFLKFKQFKFQNWFRFQIWTNFDFEQNSDLNKWWWVYEYILIYSMLCFCKHYNSLVITQIRMVALICK